MVVVTESGPGGLKCSEQHITSTIKADGKQNNDGDRQHPQADQLPVPPAHDRAELSTAAEDVDMQIVQHSDDQIEPNGHSTPTSTHGVALPGGSYAPEQREPKNQPNDQQAEPKEPQPTQPLYQYGLISLFDGCASTHDLIAEAAGTAPTIFIAAENDPEIRQYVGARTMESRRRMVSSSGGRSLKLSRADLGQEKRAVEGSMFGRADGGKGTRAAVREQLGRGKLEA